MSSFIGTTSLADFTPSLSDNPALVANKTRAHLDMVSGQTSPMGGVDEFRASLDSPATNYVFQEIPKHKTPQMAAPKENTAPQAPASKSERVDFFRAMADQMEEELSAQPSNPKPTVVFSNDTQPSTNKNCTTVVATNPDGTTEILPSCH